MTDTAAEERIRELRGRLERDPGSRYFVPLAEELRRSGRLAEAIGALEGGLAIHPSYVAARIAVARAYLEAGRIEESIGAFSRALADDPSNLVAAKALGDLHLSRGQRVEALKRYLRYRAISGDRRLDDTIARLEAQTAPPPERAPELPPPLPPPPVAAVPPAPISAPPERPLAEPPRPRVRDTDPYDITSVPYQRPSKEIPLVPEARGRFEPAVPGESFPDATWPFAPPAAPASEPSGRTLADLYFEQGHYEEALRAYDELLSAEPSDGELLRSREAAVRLAKVRVLNEWIGALGRRERGR